VDPDLFLVIGAVLLVLAVPSLLSAFAESRPPRTAAILAIAAGILIVVAVRNNPSGYSISELPDVFIRVFGRYIN
jgi:hypothetical protein